MHTLKLSLAALFVASVVTFAQDVDQIEIGSEEWFRSGVWKQDKQMEQLYQSVYESVKKSRPVYPAVEAASAALEAKRNAAILQMAKEHGVVVDQKGNLLEDPNFNKKIWYELIAPIEKDYYISHSKLWESWTFEFNERFVQTFMETARNLKINAEKMK